MNQDPAETYEQQSHHPQAQQYAQEQARQRAIAYQQSPGAQVHAPHSMASVQYGDGSMPYPGYATQDMSKTKTEITEMSVNPASSVAMVHKSYDLEHGQAAERVAKAHGMSYFRQHSVTAPWFGFLDGLEPDVRRRWVKKPRYIKLGTTSTKSGHQRRRYAIEKAFGRDKSGGSGHRLKDYLGRVQHRQKDDRYISNFDGRLKELVTMSCDYVFYEENDVTWNRTRMNNLAPFSLRVADWCAWNGKSTTGLSTGRRVARRVAGGFMLLFPSIPSGFFISHGARSGMYEDFAYSLHGYAKVPRNEIESHDRWEVRMGQFVSRPKKRIYDRAMGPAMLCKITWPEENPAATSENEEHMVNGANIHIVRTADWDAGQTGQPFPEFVFIAFIQRQFPQETETDLHRLAIRAARDAGVNHYWIASSCMQDPNNEIYQISDIVRTSKSVVIAINSDTGLDSLTLLKQFGERVWTLPELLLAPNRENIFRVYSQKGTMFFTRYQMVRDIWSDPIISRQLVEHYEGNLELSRLELSVIALKSFYSRERGFKYEADREYALMGLLRQRPIVNPDYTAFEAFASLSLLADNDQLLERLICMQPLTRDQKWNDMEDAYGSQLWDVYPHCQVAGFGHGHPTAAGSTDPSVAKYNNQLKDTILVDGMKGTKVRWKSFAPVCTIKRPTIMRRFIDAVLAWATMLVYIGLFICLFAKDEASIIIVGLIFLLPGLGAMLITPELLLKRAGGKIWGNEPWLFGVEGYCDIGILEARIFGINLGHLKWAPFGSPLSRHEPNEYGDVVGLDPMSFTDVRNHVTKIRQTNKTRVFMLIDTSLMTVTLFEAARPPIAFLLAGSEGGMQRAIGVSYDWTTNTLYRECVLRMETTCEDNMTRVSRLRLGLRRQD